MLRKVLSRAGMIKAEVVETDASRHALAFARCLVAIATRTFELAHVPPPADAWFFPRIAYRFENLRVIVSVAGIDCDYRPNFLGLMRGCPVVEMYSDLVNHRIGCIATNDDVRAVHARALDHALALWPGCVERATDAQLEKFHPAPGSLSTSKTRSVMHENIKEDVRNAYQEVYCIFADMIETVATVDAFIPADAPPTNTELALFAAMHDLAAFARNTMCGETRTYEVAESDTHHFRGLLRGHLNKRWATLVNHDFVQHVFYVPNMCMKVDGAARVVRTAEWFRNSVTPQRRVSLVAAAHRWAAERGVILVFE